MAMTKQFAASRKHQALADNRPVEGHDGSECYAMCLKTELRPFRPVIQGIMMMSMNDHFCAHCLSELIDLWIAVRVAAGSLVAYQNVRLLHSEREVVIRVNC